MSLASVIEYRDGPNVDFLSGVVLIENGAGINDVTRIKEWNIAGTAPAQAEVDTIAASQAFLDWEAENGGNPTLTARRIIREAIDTPEGKVLVALVKVMIDQGIIAATPAQVRTAIENKIAAGEVD